MMRRHVAALLEDQNESKGDRAGLLHRFLPV